MLDPLRGLPAVTGTKVSPPLFQSIAVLGKASALARGQKAVAVLQAAASGSV